MTPIRLAVVGDSISLGAGASPGHSWVDQLAELLAASIADNQSEAGASVLSMVRPHRPHGAPPGPVPDEPPQFNAARLATAAPTVTIVVLGVNDYMVARPVTQYQALYAELLAKICAAVSTRIVCVHLHQLDIPAIAALYPGALPPDNSRSPWASYFAGIRAAAKPYAGTLVDASNVGLQHHLLDDLIHPDQDGHDLLMEHIATGLANGPTCRG